MVSLQALQPGKRLASSGFHPLGKKTYHHSDGLALSFSGNTHPEKSPAKINSGLGMVKRLLKLVSVGLLGALPLTVASPSAKAQDMSAVYIATTAATMDSGSSTQTSPSEANQQSYHDPGLAPLLVPAGIMGGIFGLASLHRWLTRRKETELS
jgi:hypothetical protein